MVYYRFIDLRKNNIYDIPQYKQYLHNEAINLLIQSVKKEYNLTISENDITRDINNKPSLLNYPQIKFNLTHTDGIVACVLSKYLCGIDCEKINKFHLKATKRIFSPAEFEFADNNAERFCKIWTLKECYSKISGKGLSSDLCNISFSLDSDNIVCTDKSSIFFQYSLCNYIVSVGYNSNKNDIIDKIFEI